jgi:amino-acid N-acetyltransferase
MQADIKVDRARVTDANSMHRLIGHFADKGEMLPRALSEIYDGIRDYFVVREGGRVIACAALQVTWAYPGSSAWFASRLFLRNTASD